MKVTLSLRARLLLLILGIVWSVALDAQAEVELQGKEQLIESLRNTPHCCVIDARADAIRHKHPLSDALPYRSNLSIIPTASIVVVAESDHQAREVGFSLAKKYPGRTIYAVRGGVTAWEYVLQSLDASTSSSVPGAPAAPTFVIPHNTCETGTPLQILRSKSKP